MMQLLFSFKTCSSSWDFRRFQVLSSWFKLILVLPLRSMDVGAQYLSNERFLIDVCEVSCFLPLRSSEWLKNLMDLWPILRQNIENILDKGQQWRGRIQTGRNVIEEKRRCHLAQAKSLRQTRSIFRASSVKNWSTPTCDERYVIIC